MRFWWVNQNQTYRQEVPGGYLWSPKRNRNGQLNPFYEFMREVAPGDLVFSFADTRIRAFGIAQSYAFSAPKPLEFGSAGRNWDEIGWRVEVLFQEIQTHFRPVEWMEVLRPLLPAKYSPLRPNGYGNQGTYLTKLEPPLALVIANLIGSDVRALARGEGDLKANVIVSNAEQRQWEDHLLDGIAQDDSLAPTEKEALVLARRGQGTFRKRVQEIETSCRVTRVSRPEHLRASHCKPWRDANNAERLDGENGLLLTPSIDHLFDRGFISFRDDGRLLVSPIAHQRSIARMGVPVDRDFDAGTFSRGQIRFLEFHRDKVFLESRASAS